MAYACDFSDGASDYDAADVLKVWTSGTIGSIGTSDVDGGTLVSPTLNKTFLNSSAARIVGFRYRRLSTPVSNAALFAFTDGGALQVVLLMNSSGQLTFEVSGTTFIGPDTTTPMSEGTYYIIEFGVLMSNTAGRVEVRINGNQIAALTSAALGGSISNSLDTSATANQSIDGMSLSGVATITDEVDWIWTKYDSAVWSASDWLGSVRKITRRPKAGTAGNGFYNTGTGWSIGAGTTTISDVLDETTMDSDTSYIVRAAAAGTDADRFSVKYEAMPSNTNTVKLMSHRSWVRNTSGSTSTHKRFLYESTGATTHDSGVTVTDGTAYATGVSSGTTTSGDHMQDNYLTHPNGSALSKTLVDSTEGGVKVVTLA